MSTLVVGSGRSERNDFVLVALLCLIPGIVWLISVGDLIAYFTHHLPKGQLLYLFSKLCGLYAYFFITLQIIFGTQGARSPYFKFHPRLGVLTTLTVTAHVALFVIAASLRSGQPALDNFVPDFSKGFYKSAVSLGIVAAYGLILVLLAITLRKKYPFVFKLFHRIAFAVGTLGWLHSFLIGTETRVPVIMAFYALLLIYALYFLLKRYALAAKML